jgi:antitoxin (DNA-binding transcriptional repressor) of toxin-antitoxin stability system
MSQVTATEARASLPEILDRVDRGDEVVITRHGRPVAVVVRPDALRVRRADEAFHAAERLGELLVRAADIPLHDLPRLDQARADELVAEVRAGRDRPDRLRS